MCRGTVTIQDGQRGSLTKVTLTNNKEQMQSVTLHQLKERVVSEVPGIRGKKNNHVYNLTGIMKVTRIMVRFISKSAVLQIISGIMISVSNFCISLSCSDDYDVIFVRAYNKQGCSFKREYDFLALCVLMVHFWGFKTHFIFIRNL